MILFFALGTTDGVWGVSRNTLAQLLVPDALRGRVMSVVMLVHARRVRNWGPCRAGLLVGLMGAPAAVLASAAIIGAGVVGSWRVPLPAHAAAAGKPERCRPGAMYTRRGCRDGEDEGEDYIHTGRAKAASPLLHLFSALLFAMLFVQSAAAAPRPSQDEWRIDPLRGPVDLGLTDPSLIGAIDVHLHLDRIRPAPAA